MSNDHQSQSLRARAEALRGTFNRAPEDTDKRLATIERSETEQIRVSWCEWIPPDGGESRPYIQIRLWTRSQDKQWWPSKKGLSVRVRELPDLADGVAAALDEALVASGLGR